MKSTNNDVGFQIARLSQLYATSNLRYVQSEFARDLSVRCRIRKEL
jgi:hypothetical protein